MRYDGEEYFYVFNIFGDVINLLDDSGFIVVEYRYDSFGNIIYQTSGTLAEANPYRYRSYRYDEETEYYYLQSRYYNPETGRFINADGMMSASNTVLGTNMFAYTENNPVMRTDPSGYLCLSYADSILDGCTLRGGGDGLGLVVYYALQYATVTVKTAMVVVTGLLIYDSMTDDQDNLSDQIVSIAESTSTNYTNRYKSKYIVYLLVDAGGTAFYVGITRNWNKRKTVHAKTYDAIYPGFQGIFVVENVSLAQARVIETGLIATFLAKDYFLHNVMLSVSNKRYSTRFIASAIESEFYLLWE